MQSTIGPMLEVAPQDAIKILKTIGNPIRFKILSALKNGPLSISELAKNIGLSQPGTTKYINQLRAAGLVSTRMHHSMRGNKRVCSLLYDGISVRFADMDFYEQEDVHTIEIPVGHYIGIDCQGRSLLASAKGVIASQDNFSQFFHPVRMEASLLFLSQGQLRYIFPFNDSDVEEVLGFDLVAELNAVTQHPAQSVEMVMSLNGHRFDPLCLQRRENNEAGMVLPAWYPPEFPGVGNLLTWSVDKQATVINGRRQAAGTIEDYTFEPGQPIEVIFEVKGQPDENAGILFFGKSFGSIDQDIRLIIHVRKKTHRATDSA